MLLGNLTMFSGIWNLTCDWRNCEHLRKPKLGRLRMLMQNVVERLLERLLEDTRTLFLINDN